MRDMPRNKIAHKTENTKTTANKETPRWFFIIPLIIPILFFVFLEMGLRLFNYGMDYTIFKPVYENYPGKLFINPNLPRKYFSGLKNAPSVVPDAFDNVKKENAFRIFVLGESSTAGWPYIPNASFPREIKRRLELIYPDNEIEVINCGVSAINTYTIRDIVPGIIKEKPDLILVYTGHNEYYGALGAASSVSLGHSRVSINLYLWLQRFKTTQLAENMIRGIAELFNNQNSDEPQGGETLMSKMIGKNLITLDSDLYKEGIKQFEGNMKDIIEMFQVAKIPVILGTLTCNLKDQKPFISVKGDNLPPADNEYTEAQQKLKEGKIEEAKTLFLKAKELDALRFRAPQEINNIILRLAHQFNLPLIDIDSVFKAASPDGIVGNNLTVDHLHPNIAGYRIIGKSFLRAMELSHNLPKGIRSSLSDEIINSTANAEYPITKLDSIIAEMKIIILTGEYPFVPKGTPNYRLQNYKPKDYADSIAMAVMNNKILWEEGHVKIADWYFNKGDFFSFRSEMMAIIYERPFNEQFYEYTINKLIGSQQFTLVLPVILKYNSFRPSYFTYKWLGQIYLNNKNYKKALFYLEPASKLPDADSKLFYNLGGAYYFNNSIDKAISALEKSLSLNPQNKLASSFYSQLKTVRK
jgi:tetratricopeptide (TPR) repeat protein